ncbi:MAG: tol-pal system-associated acyl-CoA thioesterase [Gammaproteobacteria bacterium]
MQKFSWPIRVYHEDVDTMSIVYYANYLRFYERARTEHLRAIGFQQDKLMKDLGIMFVVRTVKLDYLLPAKYNDQLIVTSETTSFKRISFDFDQKIYRANEEETILNKAMVTVVCINTKTMKPCSIPDNLLQKIQHS